MGETIQFTRPDGESAPGYLATPRDAANAPGLVLVEEWWGVTDWIKSVADDYAAAGYRALVPDLFRGRNASVPDEANHLAQSLDFGDAANQDIAGAAQYLKKQGGRTGVTGYCMGGALTFLSALYTREFDAAVVFYGFPPPEAGDLSQIAIPIECHFAEHDDFFTPDRGRELERELTARNPKAKFYWYEAKHGFCNPNEEGNAGLGHHHPKACEEAWQRTLQFWKTNLSR
ncbi:MAG: dienelactone hydrolase family protein [Candidatus Eremiobacteraeota bacterium]|nr:dienelactone hydrolase family protein [Candidatus Eremiobacteraeota bacterium]